MNFPKDGIRLHITNFDAIGQQLKPMLESGDCYRLVIKPWRETRSLSQNAMAHAWFGVISEYLIKRGKAFATPEWVKDALKHTYLGYETTERVDVVTGEVTSVQSLRHTSKLETRTKIQHQQHSIISLAIAGLFYWGMTNPKKNCHPKWQSMTTNTPNPNL